MNDLVCLSTNVIEVEIEDDHVPAIAWYGSWKGCSFNMCARILANTLKYPKYPKIYSYSLTAKLNMMNGFKEK